MKMGMVVTCVIALSAEVGCSSALTYTPRADALAPGADVRVSAEVEAAQSLTRVRVRASNLPPPSRLSPSGRTFVVWARPNANVPWGRVGALTYDEGGRSGDFAGTVPFVVFDLMVSTEAASDVATPSDKVLIAQHIGS